MSNEKKCDVCGWKLQKRKCGFVCKNWKCYKFWKYGKTIEQRWREEGILGRVGVGKKLYEVLPDKIIEVDLNE